MRYYTRSLHESLQSVFLGPDDEGFEDRCTAATRLSADTSLRYLDYLQQHDVQLTNAVRELTTHALHDSHIIHVKISDQTVELLLDTRQAPMIKDDSVHIKFLGVLDVSGAELLSSQFILAEELYIHDDGTFEFSVLCNRTEFCVRFIDVEIHPAK